MMFKNTCAKFVQLNRKRTRLVQPFLFLKMKCVHLTVIYPLIFDIAKNAFRSVFNEISANVMAITGFKQVNI